MKLNRNCPHFADCQKNNERVGDLWGHECPRGWKTGKRDFTQCNYYQRWEIDDAVHRDNGTPG